MTKRNSKNTEILVIGDAHFQPNINDDRATWAGMLAVKRLPDVIVCIGDWADMKSLSMYDKGSVYHEGLRYFEDINSSIEALQKFHAPIDKYNKRMKAKGKKQYKPELVFCVGNHEQRIIRYGASNPEMHNHISLDDLGFNEWGWKVVPFLQPYICNGIAFSHYFTSGVMARPIGGDNHANALLRKGAMSSVVGHSHLLDYSEKLNAAQKKICALVTGCFFEHDENWTSENNRYWRGLCYLRDVKDGVFTPEPLTMEWLKRKFS